jgi:hypothetical protein
VGSFTAEDTLLETQKFYNAGQRIQERFSYTNPELDHRVSNCVSYWMMDAPKQGFFEVPREVQTSMGSTLVNLPKEVLDRYGERGVVKIDRNLDVVPDEPEFAYIVNSEQMAREKGEALWKTFCRKRIEDFEKENEIRVMQRNLPPMRPNGFVVSCFKELGLMVPGDEKFIAAGAQKTDVSELKETVANQQKLIEQLIAQRQESEPTRKGK